MADRSRRFHAVSPSGAVQRRVRRSVLLLLGIAVVGTIGFKFFSTDPRATWIDCAFMTVTTMTTVGFGEIVPLGQGGRLFVIGFLIAGFGIISYGAVEIGQWVFSAEARRFLER